MNALKRMTRMATEIVAVVAVCVFLLAMLAGCVSSKKADAALAMTKAQSDRQAMTEAVLLKLAEGGGTVVADPLATIEPGTAAGWSKAQRAIRMVSGEPLLVEGKPVFETVEAVGKSRSDRDIAGVTEGTLTLAGLPRGKDGDVDINAPFDGFRLEIVAVGGSAGMNADWMKAYMDGLASEKAAILGGMATLAEKRGAAFAVKVSAISKGATEFLTAAGPIVGQIIKLSPVAAAASLAEAGVSKIVEATVKTSDGTTKVVAADSTTSTAATDATEAYEQEASAAVPPSN